MQFTSLGFLIFLPTVFVLYWFVFRKLRAQNFFVVAVSYTFYGWWNWQLLGLIIFTSVCSYASGLLVERAAKRGNCQKFFTVANIVVNLGILGLYKYYNFFVDSFVDMMSLLGIHLSGHTLQLVLPVGISFYTFQALSYTIDVYRGKLQPTHNLVQFMAYISFFPQLVAGPIERATHLLPQFARERRFDYAQAVDGCRQMLWGFFKKVYVADQIATFVDLHWDGYASMSGIQLVVLALGFTIQIYCDFSAYSDIAIGCARLFGIDLRQNFAYPYFSRNIAEFWRRWHISLTTWFMDYLYIPLGGNRCSRWRHMFNIVVVFAISGLWHGARYTFVVWGLYHAVLLVFERMWGVSRYTDVVAKGRVLPNLVECLQMLSTVILVTIGWVFFRAQSIDQAVDFIAHMFSPASFWGPTTGERILLYSLPMLALEWWHRNREHGLQFSHHGLFKNRVARYALYYLLIYAIFVEAGYYRPLQFIYFRF